MVKINILISKQATTSQDVAYLKKMRANLHFNLATTFGGIPIVVSNQVSINSLSRNDINTVYNLVESDLKDAESKLSGSQKKDALFELVVLAASRQQYDQVLDNANKLINTGITLEEKQLYINTLLFKCEALNTLGNKIDALASLNSLAAYLVLPYFGNNMTAAEIKAQVMHQFNTYSDQKAIKYVNISRWNKNSLWGKYVLMPIPENAIAVNNKLTQNVGWQV